MIIVKKILDIRNLINIAKSKGKKIGFVPTMGALHDGHLELVKEAKKVSDFVVVSIFINPIQFGENEDLDKYPRDLDGDSKKLENLGVDVIFYPQVIEIYPDNYQTKVSLSIVTKGLCGDKREGHFDGVATVVLKLFNIVTPNIAFFGLKDYQQFKLVNQMVKDLNLDIEIRGVNILRESDGLAMSSRNLNLTKEGRIKAGLINVIIRDAINKFRDNEFNFSNSEFVINFVKTKLEDNGFIIDYIEIRDSEKLFLVEKIDNNSMIFIATFIDNVRLIDNFFFKG
jgi:pantoate--beta-alanine ligase